MRSTVIDPPSRTENPHSTQARYGASKFIKPKKFILFNIVSKKEKNKINAPFLEHFYFYYRMVGLRRPHTYTNMMVSALPRKMVLTKKAIIFAIFKEKLN
jgi:hypothetical protein